MLLVMAGDGDIEESVGQQGKDQGLDPQRARSRRDSNPPWL